MKSKIFLWDLRLWIKFTRRRATKQKFALDRATRKQNNQFFTLLNDAANRSYLISVTLSNRKVYIGYVKTAPSLDPQDVYFRLYLVLSGYRDKDNLQLTLTTDYNLATEALRDPIFVILPTKEIHVANRFEPLVICNISARLLRKQAKKLIPVSEVLTPIPQLCRSSFISVHCMRVDFRRDVRAHMSE